MFEIRLARRSDASLIAHMSGELIESGLGWSWTQRRVLNSINDRDTNVIVATHNDAIAGFALLKYLEEHAHLLLFAVAPPMRRRGLGRMLWQWLKVTANVAGIRTVNLEVRAKNRGAREFYQVLGFVETETIRGYYRGIEPAVRMRASVSQVAASDSR